MGRTRRGRGSVVGLGLCVEDHLYVVERLDPDAERIRYVERMISSGGMVGNALMQAAKLGCDAHALSLVGDDTAGRMLARALRRTGVRTGRLLRAQGRETTVAVVIVERGTGERRFLVADRTAHERDAPDFDLAPIREGSILLIDGHFPRQARRAVRHARAVGATVVADFNQPTRDAVALLPDVDYPVLPAEFALAYAGADLRDSVRGLRREYGGTPIVTSGARGGYYWSNGRVRRYRSPRVRVRDTTGAGDAFHGAFAASLARGRSLDDAIECAARAGARCCTALGATGHLLPTGQAARRG